MENREQPNRRVIQLTENRELIAEKLKEYRERFARYKPEDRVSVSYKIAVAEALVNQGEADYDVIFQEIRERDGVVDEGKLLNAYSVLADYIRAGGKHVKGGTGLHKAEGEDQFLEDFPDDGRIH